MPEAKARKGQEGGAKPSKRSPQAWEDEDFPRMEERSVVEAKIDPTELAKMRAAAKKKMHQSQGEDPATLARRWDVSFSVTGIENTTSSDWEVFLAVNMSSATDRRGRKNRLHQSFTFTRSYEVKANRKKQFKVIESIIARTWEGSYKELAQQEIAVDAWLVSKTNFNQILGTARKSLYDLGCESVYQTMLVKPNEHAGAQTSFDVGILYVNAVVSEVMQFTIVASNWQFQPRPELQDFSGQKHLRIEVPTGRGKPLDVFETAAVAGPRYCWARAGQFVYKGTRVGLSMEALTISVFASAKLQGKAVVGLAAAGEYPIAMGTVKQLSQNAEAYVQGRLGGSLAVTSRSLLLPEGTHDEDPSVPPPEQPPESLVIYHLSPRQQYLVVELQAASGLPVADTDYGSSNPFCRVKYDGAVQQCPVVMGSLAPVWNHRFYLPVRLTEPSIRTDPRFYRTLLPVEMKSKGLLELEVWHLDSVPTEFLGAVKLDLHQTRYGKEAQKALCGTAQRPAAGQAEDASLSMGVHPALCRKHLTKVYEARREALGGSWLQSATRATLSFDCYFLPDFPPDFKFPQQDAGRESGFEEAFGRWERHWLKFHEAYIAWFPEAPRKRRFLGSFLEPGGGDWPLPRLITPLALPASLAEPLKVQHWVRCTEFCAPPRQRSVGEISTWQRPEDVLSLRRGSVQDHAVLLCCALQGLGKLAYVCKGTVQGGKEHAWVMTREQLGTVTFWETTTGGKFHLPRRWLGDASRSDACRRRIEERWATAKADARWREGQERRQAMARAEHLQKMGELLRLPISPWKELYQEENIVAVPYDSIEVVFNGMQLWGNLCNHHPACIYYDMEDDARAWMPLVPEQELRLVHQGKGVAIPVGPAVSKYTAQELQHVIESEIKECVRFSRIRKGHESYFEEDEVLQETLEGYLQMLEVECQLDADWCYSQEDKAARPWGLPSPFNSFTYVQRCRGEWSRYWKMRKAMDEARVYLPVKANHVLSGIPLHISSTDLKEIRKNLMTCGPMQEYFDLAMDEVLFFVCAKVFPMPSSVNSVWVFLGAAVPLAPERVYELARKEMQDFMEHDPDASEASDAPEEGKEKKKKKKKKGDWFQGT